MSRCVLIVVRYCLAVLLSGAASAVFAQDLAELRWDHQLVHYTPAETAAFDAWIISPPKTDKRSADDLASVLEAISREKNTTIAHLYLSRVMLRPEVQDAVMKYVAAQPEFLHRPPPTGFGRWEFKNSDQIRALVAEGLMRSPFVADCNLLLRKYGKSVGHVSMEKLFFTKKDGQWGWNAGVWLMVDPLPMQPAK